MDGEGEGCSAGGRSPPRTSTEGGGGTPIVSRRGPPSVLVTRPWGGSLAIAPSAVAAQSLLSPAAAATSAGHIPALAWAGPRWIGFSQSESAQLAASASRVMADRSADEHIVRRVSVPEKSPYDDDQERLRCAHQHHPQKRRRSYHSTDAPAPHLGLTSSGTTTSCGEFPVNVFASSTSSSFMRHHLGSYRPLSGIPHGGTSAVGSSLLPWSVELATGARSQAAAGPLGVIRPPPAYPLTRADAHLSRRPVDVFQDAETERHLQQQSQTHLSTSGSDQPSSFTAVTHHCIRHERSTCTSCANTGYQPNEGNSSLIS